MFNAFAGVRVKVSRLLPSGSYALMQGDRVVWDSITKLPADLPGDPARWDGVMMSPGDFERLKTEGENAG
jgi:hypothetical protein